MSSILRYFVNLSRLQKMFFVGFLDFLSMLIAVYLAFIILNNKILPYSSGPQASFLISITSYFIFSIYFKNYNIVYRYFNYRDIFNILKATILSAFLIFLTNIFTDIRYFFQEISYILNQYLIFFILINLIRYFIKFTSFFNSPKKSKEQSSFIYGAGVAGLSFSESIFHKENIIGFIDDDVKSAAAPPIEPK